MVASDKTKSRANRVIALVVSVMAGSAMTATYAHEDADAGQPLKVRYEQPGVDYSKYHSLLIDELDVATTKIVPPPWKADKPFSWKVTEKNFAALQAAFTESMRDQISANSGYPIVAEPGPGILEFNLRIVSFMPYANRDEQVTTRGSGEMRIHVEIRDSQSGDLLAMYEGPQEVGQDYRVNSDFTRQDNLKSLFDNWGRRIRAVLDERR